MQDHDARELPPRSRLLRLLTLNTWGFRWPLARHRAARFRRIGARLDAGGYDVVALQELWRGAKEALGQRSLQWAPPGRPASEGKRHRRIHMVDSGLGVKVAPTLCDASRLTVTAHTFRDHRGWDRVKHKGLLRVDLPLEGLGDVSLIVTHLQAQPKHGRIRRAQLDELGALIDGLERPIILLGDFNLHNDSDEDRAGHAQLERWGFTDAGEALDRPFATYLRDNPYVPWHEGDERFDRVYLRDGRDLRLEARAHQVLVDHSSPLSDHEAVEATIIVTEI